MTRKCNERSNMYQCRACNIRFETPARVYDSYDREIYEGCPVCKGGAERAEAECDLCHSPLFIGETAVSVGKDIYCSNCAYEVTV